MHAKNYTAYFLILFYGYFLRGSVLIFCCFYALGLFLMACFCINNLLCYDCMVLFLLEVWRTLERQHINSIGRETDGENSLEKDLALPCKNWEFLWSQRALLLLRTARLVFRFSSFSQETQMS